MVLPVRQELKCSHTQHSKLAQLGEQEDFRVDRQQIRDVTHAAAGVIAVVLGGCVPCCLHQSRSEQSAYGGLGMSSGWLEGNGNTIIADLGMLPTTVISCLVSPGRRGLVGVTACRPANFMLHGLTAAESSSCLTVLASCMAYSAVSACTSMQIVLICTAQQSICCGMYHVVCGSICLCSVCDIILSADVCAELLTAHSTCSTFAVFMAALHTWPYTQVHVSCIELAQGLNLVTGVHLLHHNSRTASAQHCCTSRHINRRA